MHAFFELGTPIQSDSTIQALSWMGKVPDDIPESSGWRLNRSTYYQEGWLATGNSRGLVGVTFTASRCMYGVKGKEPRESALPQRTNFNLRGHRAQVIFVCWNEPYQKLASVDAAGVIFVWVRYESRWSIELINDRGIPVRHFSWSHDGRLALIAYQDGFVLVGSVAGQRFWSASIGTESTILCGTWSPDDQQVYLGMSNGSITVLDIHGNLMAQVRISSGSTYYVSTNTVNSLAWNCAKFKMDDVEESGGSANKSGSKVNVLAALCNKSCLYFMTSYDDPTPVVVCTGLNSCHMEWSNSGEHLAVGGTSRRDGQGNFLNMVKFYTATGSVRYVINLTVQANPITSLTWGHNDRRIFVATGVYLHVGWVARKPPSLSHLSRISIRNRLMSLVSVGGLPLPVKLKAQVSCLFSRTVYNIMGSEPSLRSFATQPPPNNTRLFCTMIRLEDGSTDYQSDPDGEFGNLATYVLYVEFLGGLVPLLKGKRTSKLRPEFIIFDPECTQPQRSDLINEDAATVKQCQSPRRGVFKSPGSPLLARFSPRLARRQNNTQRRPTANVDPLAHIEMLVQAGLLNPPSPEEVSRDRNRDQNELRRVRVGGFNPDDMDRRGRTSDPTEEVNEWSHLDMLPEYSKLAEVTSNIWGTRFRLTGLGDGIPEDLGQITYRTSLLHLQPRQMTLLVTVLDDAAIGTEPEPLKPPDLKADPEEMYGEPGNQDYGVLQEIPIAPMTPRLPRLNQSGSDNRRSVLLENTDNSDEDEHLLLPEETVTSPDICLWDIELKSRVEEIIVTPKSKFGGNQSPKQSHRYGGFDSSEFAATSDSSRSETQRQCDVTRYQLADSHSGLKQRSRLLSERVESACAVTSNSSEVRTCNLDRERTQNDMETNFEKNQDVHGETEQSDALGLDASQTCDASSELEWRHNPRDNSGNCSPFTPSRKLLPRSLVIETRMRTNSLKVLNLENSETVPSGSCTKSPRSIATERTAFEGEEVMKIQLSDGVPYKMVVSRPRSFSASHIDFVKISVESWASTRGQKNLSPRKLMRLLLKKRRSKTNFSARQSRSLDSSPMIAFNPNFQCPLPKEEGLDGGDEKKGDLSERWLHKPPREESLQTPVEPKNPRGKSAPPTPNSSPRSVRRRQAVRRENCSPIRQIFSSPLMPRRWRSAVETSVDDSSDSSSSEDESKTRQTRDFTNLEAFQRQQLRNKVKRQGGGLDARRDKNRPRQVVLHNKAPFWNEHSQVYQLDFGGRVTQESAKNFQIEFQGKQVMQFGRIDARAYTLDFQYPFSPTQAFGVALANVTQRLK